MVASAPSPMVRDPLPVDSRYECLTKIATGGMASVYLGRLRGAAGFWRLVAVKRAHAHLLEDPTFRRMLVAEARLASKIHHPNVVAVQDVEELAQELFLVMDYVEGAALSELDARSAERSGGPLSPSVVARIGIDACSGLHAAHELTDDAGAALGLVHRDVSPQNLLVGLDGATRIADFGIAKSFRSGTSATTTGALKGKVAYMAPEYIEGEHVDARSDVFALGVVLWEAFTGQRLFRGPTELDTLRRVVDRAAPKLSSVWPNLAPFDSVIARALEKAPSRRFQTAHDLGIGIEEAARQAGLRASQAEVAATVRALVGEEMERRRAHVRERIAAGPHAPLAGEPISDAGRDGESSIHVSLVGVPRAGSPAAGVEETTTLGSSVSSRRILIRRGDRTRRNQRWMLAGAAVTALAALVVSWRLSARQGPPFDPDQSTVRAQMLPRSTADTSSPRAATAALAAPTAPVATSSASTAPALDTHPVARPTPPSPRVLPKRPASAGPTSEPPDPALAPPAPNPYSN